MAIGHCRTCGKVIGYEEWRCPYCGTTAPVRYPWLQNRLPWWRSGNRLVRRWKILLVVVVVLTALIALWR